MSQAGHRHDAERSPPVTVAILAYNRREALRVNLTKLRDELEWPRERLEVIVVDNASTDGTAAMVAAEFPDVRVIVNERNTGISGWNRAFETGAGDWFLVLDDDCYVSGAALRRAVSAAQAHAADLVSFWVVSSEPGEVAFNQNYDTGLLAFWGCSALVSGRAVRELGGFDPGIFIWGHEAEFVARLLDRGMRRLHLPDVISVHMKPVAPWRMSVHQRNLQSLAYVAAKLLRPPELAPVAGNLLLRVLTEAGHDPRLISSLSPMLRGLRGGLRNRAPVRAPVSRLYRADFIEFASPLRFVRGPLLRWRQRGRPDLANADIAARRQRYWRARPSTYPEHTATLTV